MSANRDARSYERAHRAKLNALDLTAIDHGLFWDSWRRYKKTGSPKMPPPWVRIRAATKSGGHDEFVALQPGYRSRTASEEEPWLIHGELRYVANGPPVISRITVRHFEDPEAEVTGYALRDLPLASIRARVLQHLEV